MKKHIKKKMKIFLWGKIKKIKLPNVSWFVFAVCILLVMMMIFPSFFHRLPVYDYYIAENELPYELQIYGSINYEENEEIYISIGGFKQKVDRSGEYSLNFVSNDKEKISVCIIDKQGELLDYFLFSMENNQWSKKFDCTIHGGN